MAAQAAYLSPISAEGRPTHAPDVWIAASQPPVLIGDR